MWGLVASAGWWLLSGGAGGRGYIDHFSSLGLSVLTYKQRARGSMTSNGPFRAERSLIDHAEWVQGPFVSFFSSLFIKFLCYMKLCPRVHLLLWLGSQWLSLLMILLLIYSAQIIFLNFGTLALSASWMSHHCLTGSSNTTYSKLSILFPSNAAFPGSPILINETPQSPKTETWESFFFIILLSYHWIDDEIFLFVFWGFLVFFFLSVPGIKSGPWKWKHQVLTTGSPGNS